MTEAAAFARRGAVLGAALVLAACADQMPTGTPGDAQQSAAPAKGPQQERGPKNPDQDLVDLAAKVPGFGGLGYEADGTLRVVLTERGRADQARPAIAAFLRGRMKDETKEGGVPRMSFVRGRYEFPEIVGWKARLREVVFREPGVVFLDADEFRNRVTIGLASEGDEARVRERIASLNLPHDAVGFEVRGPTELAASLRNAVSPRVGGLGIGNGRLVSNGSLQDCTMGPQAWYNGQMAFVTNSHCTGAFFSNTGTSISQGGSWVGVEVMDEPLFQGSYGCPSGSWCRNSDAAIIDYNSGISATYGIAFTSLPPCTGGTWCDTKLTINGTVTVTGENWPVMGMDLNKTGQRTGWTRGPVVQTCADTPYDPIYWAPAGGTITPIMLCQIHVQAGVYYGDSGSPVYSRYTYTSGHPGYAEIHGVLWGRSLNGLYFYASSIDGVKQDLGWFWTY